MVMKIIPEFRVVTTERVLFTVQSLGMWKGTIFIPYTTEYSDVVV